MHRSPRRVVALKCLLYLGLMGLAACGSRNDDNDAGEAAAPSAEAPPSTAGPTSSRGALLEVNDITVVTKAQSDAAAIASNVDELGGPALCDVRVQSIAHATVGPRAETTRNSAALLRPQGAGCNGPFPLVAYARGTSQERGRTLADPADKETTLLINIFAARGYIVVATDYLGYAGSDFPYHPYLHAGSEASSVIDSIRAARSALTSAAVPLSGKLFLTGYSQGGHATLAAQREIERAPGGDLAVAASGPMSGPYDLALTLSEGTAAVLPALEEEDPSPAARVRLLLVDSVAAVAGVIADLSIVRNLLSGESVVDFTPRAPVLLCGGARDLTVPFANTTSAATMFRTRGSSVGVVDIDQEPAFAARRPASGAPASELGSYHQRTVPPLCFQVVRDRLFEPLR